MKATEGASKHVGRIGIGICYDIRFQELAMLYAARGPLRAHLLCYPGAFNMTTGPLHWELLQRARAADNQVKPAFGEPTAWRSVPVSRCSEAAELSSR
ncbi:hypothetical protein B296_00052526 [Ensete ventricosum]|uniref:CN hydrolase domain-containing protein n=1 Tax=Ensete ventricosum TaxID=4639 RepID=A0A426YC05_ENSVE|nr:hypothetical protein B296_00052526 [Ensete ventricosum]